MELQIKDNMGHLIKASVADFIEAEIEARRPWDGSATPALVTAFANLVQILAEKGVLTEEDVRRI